MRFFTPCRIAVLLTLLLPAAASRAQTPLAAGSAHYSIYQGDKTVGASDYTVQPTPNGYTITSHGKLTLTKFSYSFTNTQRLDTSRNLVSNQLSGTVNGAAVTFTANADSTGREFQIGISANGKQTQNAIDRHQNMVLLADLDPAAYLLLTRIVMENPPTSWILIPKENGILVPSAITRGSGTRGQLNGSQLDVQHATITIGSENPVSVDLFYTADGSVLEADLPQQNFYVVRDGFKLVNRPKPLAPSAAPSPNQGPQGANPNGVGAAPPQYPAPQGGVPPMQQQ
jgi:hypothetical protein